MIADVIEPVRVQACRPRRDGATFGFEDFVTQALRSKNIERIRSEDDVVPTGIDSTSFSANNR
jgi:hypothetical protein